VAGAGGCPTHGELSIFVLPGGDYTETLRPITNWGGGRSKTVYHICVRQTTEFSMGGAEAARQERRADPPRAGRTAPQTGTLFEPRRVPGSPVTRQAFF
jgi:hypothetical protein